MEDQIIAIRLNLDLKKILIKEGYPSFDILDSKYHNKATR